MKKAKTKKTIWVCTSCENWCIYKKTPVPHTCFLQEPQFQKTIITIKTSLSKVLKTGQPVLVGDLKAPIFFSHFDEDGDLHTFNGTSSPGTIPWDSSEWSLPTREELKTIGHADLGWLTAEDLESDHSEE